MTVPDWVQDAVIYQIFPDRFANGDPNNDPVNVRPWDTLPTRNGFHGGDLRGVIQHMEYLVDLGINVIYFTPIFQSPSTHRYNATDYLKIDPRLGTLNDFLALLDEAHRNGIKVLLDGVFNHSGRGFFAFSDILENGIESPYKDWFRIKKFPVDAYSHGEAKDYEAWWGFKSLPKFNTNNPEVRRYLLNVARYWIEQGVDGWRLDVPNEIDDDSFWAEFRQVVRAANPEAYTLGEIWDGNPRWVGDNHFDGLMNYPMREGLLKYMSGEMSPSLFAVRVEGLLGAFPHENVYAMYNLLGSHDTERIMTLMHKNSARVKLGLMFQFAYPGIPAIYYGDEIGLEGGKDPDCRRTFPWDMSRWNQGLLELMRKLVHLRHENESLRRGSFRRLWVDDPTGTYAFVRELDGQRVVVILNSSQNSQTIEISASDVGWQNEKIIHSLVDGFEYPIRDGKLVLSLAGLSGLWLKSL